MPDRRDPSAVLESAPASNAIVDRSVAQDGCPLCGADRLISLIDLRDFPAVQNRLYPSREAALVAPRCSARYLYCDRCIYAFDLAFAARPEPDWSRYDNDQSASPHYRDYIEAVVASLIDWAGLGERSVVVEPACGNGYLLSRIAARTRAHVWGCDPQYRGTFGLQDVIRPEPFHAPCAQRADLLIVRHALESVTSANAFMQNVVGSLLPSGSIYLELTDLDSVLRRGQGELWSHEYGRYFSLRALDRWLADFGLVIREARRCFGGDYLAVFAQPAPRPQSLHAGLDRVEAALARHPNVVFWGAGGRTISALTQRGWTDGQVAAVVDVDAAKQGKFIPVTGQVIVSPQQARTLNPDLVVISNAQYLDEVRAQLGPGTRLLTLDGMEQASDSSDSQPVDRRSSIPDDTDQFTREVRARIADYAHDHALQEAGQAWLREADRARYEYNFRWLGLPIIQYPEDIVGLQELIWRLRPDVIVETGVARGGATIFYASLLTLLGGDRRVVGVDIDIRAHNRARIAAHPLAARITLVSGSSTDPAVVDQVFAICRGRDRVLVCLDSNHSHDHVLAELRAYAPLVAEGSYLIVFDTSIEQLEPTARAGRPWQRGNSPATAIAAFLQETDRFVVDESMTHQLVISSNPGGYLRCVRSPDGQA